MNLLLFAARVAIAVICVVGLLLPPSTWAADVQYVVKPIAEMNGNSALRVTDVPPDHRCWRAITVASFVYGVMTV